MDISLWNKRKLNPPPNYTHRISKENEIFTELRSVCIQALSVLTDLQGLHDEGDVLSRMIYQFKCKLRCEKSFKVVEKVNRMLRRYLGLNMAHVYSTFTPLEPERIETEGYLPSRQMLEFVLVRTQSFAQIFKHIAIICEEAGKELGMKLLRGLMWDTALVLYAIISRIWAYARYLVLSSCEWFNKLRMFLDLLTPNRTPWLPEGYAFPSNLASWLNIETWMGDARPTLVPHTQHLLNLITSKASIKVAPTVETTSENKHKSFLTSLNGKENMFDGETKDRMKQSRGRSVMSTKVTKKLLKTKKRKLNCDEVDASSAVNSAFKSDVSSEQDIQDFDSEVTVPSHLNTVFTIYEPEDLGESVCREAVSAQTTNSKSVSSKEKPPSGSAKKRIIKSITTPEMLNALISRESKLRASQPKTCLTSNVDKLAWRLLRKTLRKYVHKLEQETGEVQYNKLLKEAKSILRYNVL